MTICFSWGGGGEEGGRGCGGGEVGKGLIVDRLATDYQTDLDITNPIPYFLAGTLEDSTVL
jgi:hypothetical protein